MADAFVQGFLVSISLIAAIGAQNAFVLRQGLRREHVVAVVALCALSDALLITAGVAGFGAASKMAPWLADAMLWAGVAFLVVYGAMRFRAAWQGGAALVPASYGAVPLGKVLATCLLLTWANPHVYLDTVVLLGAISAQYAPYGPAFGIGAALASLTFFSALGFGARLLAPIFAKPRAWVILEVVVGLTMWTLAAGLVLA
jgi:L-lysine exporter family protein LysE/ArgO